MRSIFSLLGVAALVAPSFAQGFFEPAVAVDINPDPLIVEVNLEAKPIQWQYFPVSDPTTLTSVWAYGDQETGVFSVPGPIIEANLGDQVIVNFTNNLPEPTSVHWHGNESPAWADGSHISSTPIPPGGFFQFRFPVLNAALYWYHPHVRTFDGVEKGLQGLLLLRDPQQEQALGLDQMEQHVIVADDILLDASKQVVPAFSFTDPLQNAMYHVNGREGNYFLINGRHGGEVNLNVRNGKPQYWRVVNTANTTFVRLDLQDANDGIAGELWEVGSDGGLVEDPQLKPRPVTNTAPDPDHPGQVLLSEMGQGILLLSAQRMEVVFTPIGTDGEVFTVYQHDWFRGRHAAVYDSAGMIMLPDDPLDGNYPTKEAMTLTLVGSDPGTGEWAPPGDWNAVTAFPPLPGPPSGSLPVTFGHGMPDAAGNVILFAQAMMMMVPGQGMVMTPLPTPKIDSFNAHDVQVGEVWDWKVTNLTHGDHSFHTHGFFFELQEYEWQDDTDPTNTELNFNFVPFRRRMQDTIRIPARTGAKGTSRTITTLRTHFDPTGRVGETSAHGMLPTFRPDGTWESGGWLFHCHMLEHAAKGMLSVLEVHEPAELFTLLGKHKTGTGGLYPSLTATGDLSPRSTVVVDLVDARPGAKVWLVIGDVAARRSFAGGELVPGWGPGTINPIVKPYFLGSKAGVADPAGRVQWQLSEWAGFPSGTTFYLQVAVRDSGGVEGWALSNALKFTKP